MANLNHLAEVLEKTAAYIDDLEGQNTTLQARLAELEGQLEKVANERDSGIYSALKDKGFNESEISNLRAMPREVLEKVANINSEAAWDFGKPVGPAIATLDPILEFCLR